MQKFALFGVSPAKLLKGVGVNGLCFGSGMYKTVFDGIASELALQTAGGSFPLFQRVFNVGALELDEICVSFLIVHQQKVTAQGGVSDDDAVDLIVADSVASRILS